MATSTPPVPRRSEAASASPPGAEDGAPADGFLTGEGLVLLAPAGMGSPHSKAASLSFGVGSRPGWPGRWRVPHAHVFEALAELSAGAVTPRLAALAALAALVAECVEAGELVPSVDAHARPIWRPAPTPRRAARLGEATDGVVSSGPPGSAGLVEEFAAAIVAELTVAAPAPALVADRGRGSRRQAADLAQWAGRVVVRRAAGARTVLRLDAPDDESGVWFLELFVVASSDPTTRLPARTALTMPDAFGATAAQVDHLVRTEAKAVAAAWGHPAARRVALGTELDGDAVVDLITSGVAALDEVGVEVTGPNGLMRAVALRRSVAVAGQPAGMSDALALAVRVDADGVEVTPAELVALAESKSGLVRLGGRWVQVRPSDLEAARRLVERCEEGASARDLLLDDAFDGADIDFGAGQGTSWVADALAGRSVLERAVHVDVPAGVTATLRHYQCDGLDWLTWLEVNGLGGVLADDMGLGKTLQVLTRVVADHSGATLVICPTSLIENWVREARRFTPGLTVTAFHGPAREDLAELAATHDVVLSSYGLLGREPAFAEVAWHRVVLDEAQVVKNPATKTARAVAALSSTHRLAVTGTPVENHLGDLWSVLSFAEPGLLGSLKSFRARYVDSAPDGAALERLGRLIGPFVLRRAKSDEGIAPELPERIDVRHDCGLSREQIGAYEATVASLLAPPDDESSMNRRGRVLAAITKLKQICVTTELLSGAETLTRRSGKLEQLEVLCDEILEVDEAVVIFTQFASVLPALAAHLSKVCGVEVVTLDGSMSRARRQRSVDSFAEPDGPPILVASLKAGGVGLNLVRANHVVHLDRWWNPAVEDQASDRTWRIGQQRTVMVHRLICPGTLEERIDAVLTDKRALAATVVSSSALPVTELSDAQLADLVGLVRDEVIR